MGDKGLVALVLNITYFGDWLKDAKNENTYILVTISTAQVNI